MVLGPMQMMLYTKRKRMASEFPNKKPRLDDEDWGAEAAGTDDLWGQSDMTAEEFDRLELQATQSVNNGSCAMPSSTNNLNMGPMKQKEYELEGRIKLLSANLEKLKGDFMLERLSKDKIIRENAEEFQKTESNLKNEIGKYQSVLQFKDHEVKSLSEKAHMLEAQLKERESVTSNRNNFIHRFKFDSKQVIKVEASVQTDIRPKIRKHQLNIDPPLGEIKNSNILSSLRNRPNISSPSRPLSSYISSLTGTRASQPDVAQCLTLSVTELHDSDRIEELWRYYEKVLRRHVVFLNNLKKNIEKNLSPLSLRQVENESKSNVASCLKDLELVLSNHPPPDSSQVSTAGRSAAETEMALPQKKESPGSSSNPLFSEEEKMDIGINCDHPLLKLLILLASSYTYPQSYKKGGELEGSLRCLIAWSHKSQDKILQCICDLPIHSLICEQSTESADLTISLLASLITSKDFKELLDHKNTLCIICSIGSLCLNKTSSLCMSSRLLMIENFLSAVFVKHFLSVKLEQSQCAVQISQGIIKVLWSYIMLNEKSSSCTIVLKQGLILLLLLSNGVPNFKEKRAAVEDCYIFLISHFLTLSKEEREFKEFHDAIHDLWDFNEEMGELDVDESAEETADELTD